MPITKIKLVVLIMKILNTIKVILLTLVLFQLTACNQQSPADTEHETAKHSNEKVKAKLKAHIEFLADDTHPLHNSALKKNADIVLVCGAGGQAALSGKTLNDMGFQNVSNVGGFSAWKDAGGPVDG